MTERVTLTQLRKLARQALGEGAVCAEDSFSSGMVWSCAAYREGVRVEARHGAKQAARCQLQSLLQRLVRGEETR